MSYFLDILAELDHHPLKDARILDFGCGEGDAVANLRIEGWDAYGCDIALGASDTARDLIAQGYLKPISLQPYRIPYDDATFDIIVSAQVFEHVMNVAEALAEVQRVLKPNGVTLHAFPARYRPIESHVYVPLGGVVRNYSWLLFWASCGIRNEFQRGLGAAETARRNRAYLISFTNYAGPKEVHRHFGRFFRYVEWVEKAALSRSPNWAGRLTFSLGRHLPIIFVLYRFTREYYVFAKYPLGRSV